MERILVVDDELSMREFLTIMLHKEGYESGSASTGVEALQQLEAERGFDLMISDIRMPGMDGIELLKQAQRIAPDMGVILITAYASIDSAVEAMELGAYDYITKPFKVEEIRHVVRNALDKQRLMRENLLMRNELRSRYTFGSIVGASRQMLEIFDMLSRVAATRSSVLVEGESGTGKELVAKAIHHNSDRKDGPFVIINCGALPENLMESELFGHKKGSFTGAIANKLGLFKLADHGTVFLDEIGDLPLSLQVKLLRVLQEKIFFPVGSVEAESVDVRIISATNRDLSEMIKHEQFREDLYYRLNVIQICMPPLKQRREDIPVLANYFLDQYSKEFGKKIVRISAEAMKALEEYNFPGNVRELENIIERAVALEKSSVILLESLPPTVISAEANKQEPTQDQIVVPRIGDVQVDLEQLVGRFEKQLLIQALDKCDGVKIRAAELLNISLRSLRYRLEKYDLDTGDEN
ncbi:MAG: sigma-54 dependent transcriptional regulator [Candidatus Alcyoniella australis]|nr:sigma-54 dependent transcriptional regulator [Candidatus Alcyoniella australis]